MKIVYILIIILLSPMAKADNFAMGMVTGMAISGDKSKKKQELSPCAKNIKLQSDYEKYCLCSKDIEIADYTIQYCKKINSFKIIDGISASLMILLVAVNAAYFISERRLSHNLLTLSAILALVAMSIYFYLFYKNYKLTQSIEYYKSYSVGHR